MCQTYPFFLTPFFIFFMKFLYFHLLQSSKLIRYAFMDDNLQYIFPLICFSFQIVTLFKLLGFQLFFIFTNFLYFYPIQNPRLLMICFSNEILFVLFICCFILHGQFLLISNTFLTKCFSKSRNCQKVSDFFFILKDKSK